MSTRPAASAATPSLVQNLASARRSAIAALRAYIAPEGIPESDSSLLALAQVTVRSSMHPQAVVVKLLETIQSIDLATGSMIRAVENGTLPASVQLQDGYPPDYEATRYATIKIGRETALGVRDSDALFFAQKGQRSLGVVTSVGQAPGLVRELEALGYEVEPGR